MRDGSARLSPPSPLNTALDRGACAGRIFAHARTRGTASPRAVARSYRTHGLYGFATVWRRCCPLGIALVRWACAGGISRTATAAAVVTSARTRTRACRRLSSLLRRAPSICRTCERTPRWTRLRHARGKHAYDHLPRATTHAAPLRIDLADR